MPPHPYKPYFTAYCCVDTENLELCLTLFSVSVLIVSFPQAFILGSDCLLREPVQIVHWHHITSFFTEVLHYSDPSGGRRRLREVPLERECEEINGMQMERAADQPKKINKW